MRFNGCFALILCLAGGLLAQNIETSSWLGGSGNWNDGTNWTEIINPCIIPPCVVGGRPDPMNGTAAFIGSTATVNITTDVTSVGAIIVNGGNYTFNLNGGSLYTTGLVYYFTPPVDTPLNQVAGVLNIQNGTLFTVPVPTPPIATDEESSVFL